ncbi:hypothetical protein SDC9_134166 [bioreactor metagenome]|uniref:Uncharacterized protein n=1 Tax=bioreactor metagenome TaxID=1076179 RepID=A0A645DDZ7_9ZZZZ
MKRVVSGFSVFKVSAIWFPSTFETKCTFNLVLKCFSADTTITGPKSDPPIPIFTTSVITFPVKPVCSPEMMLSEKDFI